MKRIVFGLLFSTLFFVGCKTEKPSANTSESSATSTVISSNEEKFEFSVYQPQHHLENNNFNLSGKADPGTIITVMKDSEVVKEIEPTASGSFSMTASLPETEDTTYKVSDGTDTKTVIVKSKTTLEKLAADIEAKRKEQDSEEAEADKSTAVEQNQKNDETTESNLVTTGLLDYQEEGMDNASANPAEPGAMLYDKTESKFKGMNYYFEGEIVGEINLENVSDGNAWLVKNENGYVMPVEYYYFSANKGDSVKVWGTLSGLGYSSKDFGVDNVVGVAGSMHALAVEINGNMEY
ncbi:hypothetical protein [Enterococcus sp. DIV0876]|uniref:hypothetical protein n=1 Tax=Enterococcus sp. DIV0876 TaxID=2774633 RepID=UPI003D2FAEE9